MVMSTYKNGASSRAKQGNLLSFAMMGILTVALVVGIVALIAVARMLARDTMQELAQSNAVQMLPSGEDPQALITQQTPEATQREEEIIEANPHFLQGEEDDWRLILVNAWNPYGQQSVPELTQLKNEQAVDSRCYEDLQDMMDDCRAQGLQPLICSSYRSVERQRELYHAKVNTLVAQGHLLQEAETEAAKSVAKPGTSEHHLGLAVDIVDIHQQMLESVQAETQVAQWLMENSYKYGFILRYPQDKSEVTGVIYEPWHYRYVGKAAAREIHDMGLCLEEYLQQKAQ